jgi:outer membrane protein assembly factor BamB
MKKKLILLTMALLMLAVVVSGCTTAGLATSWPGLNVTQDLAYVAFGNYIYAVKNLDGSLAWRFPQQLVKENVFFAAPAYENNVLVAGDYSNVLFSLNATTGQQNCDFRVAKDRYIASPLLYNGITYAPNADGHLYVLDSNGSLLWQFKTLRPNWSKPVTDGSNFYFGSMDHLIYALKLSYNQDEISADENGNRIAIQKPLWSTDLVSAIFANPVLSSQNILYAGTLGGKLFAMDTQTGKIIWSYPSTGKLGGIWSSPVLMGDVVMVGDDLGKIYALSASTGAEVWKAPIDAGAPVIGGGTAMTDKAAFITTAGKFIILDSSGSEVWNKTFTEPLYTAPKVTNDYVVLAAIGKDFLLTKFDQNGREFWSFNPPK